MRRRSERLHNLVLRLAPHTISGSLALSSSLSLSVGPWATERPGGGKGPRTGRCEAARQK